MAASVEEGLIPECTRERYAVEHQEWPPPVANGQGERCVIWHGGLDVLQVPEEHRHVVPRVLLRRDDPSHVLPRAVETHVFG
eukprot:3205441-Prymnesium_polylepis.1